MTNCNHCGGRVLPDIEHPLDAPVLKCVQCARVPGLPRAHEEPVKEWMAAAYIPGTGTSFDKPGLHERRLKQQRDYWLRKKSAGAA